MACAALEREHHAKAENMVSIAIMNAKGGVGKSTLTMAIAETLAAYHGKTVLLIDADGQMSLSLMLMSVKRLNTLRSENRSITAWLKQSVLGDHAIDWRSCIADKISDVDDATSLFLMPGDMDLTLAERAISEAHRGAQLRQQTRLLLEEAEQYVDVVLVDCAPGISVVTECWLRECQWHLIPVKPDILAISGMEYLKRFKKNDERLGFAAHLGVVINMKQLQSHTDEMICELLMENSELRCFRTAVPSIPHIQKAAMYVADGRSFQNKYPAQAGAAIKNVTAEILARVSARQ